MTIQDQVPDLSICQEAKEKGVSIESKFLYKVGVESGTVNITDKHPHPENTIHKKYFSFYTAPLTDEILCKLPVGLNNDYEGYWLKINKYDDSYVVGYEKNGIIGVMYYCEDKKLSNALYLLYMKLKSENII